MLEKNFTKVYNKFKLLLYTRILKNFDKESEDALTALEVICMEIIVALGKPTIAEFAKYAGLSAPNAAYRVNKLQHKNYIRRVQSEKDKREFHLCPTEKYQEVYGSVVNYIDYVSKRIEDRFSADEIESLNKMLDIIGNELMPEYDHLREMQKA